MSNYDSKLRERLLAQIEGSSVFGKGKVKPKKARAQPIDVRETEYVPSHVGRVHATSKTESPVYTGDMELYIGQGYNKGGLQALLKSEIRDAGKKTSQLE